VIRSKSIKKRHGGHKGGMKLPGEKPRFIKSRILNLRSSLEMSTDESRYQLKNLLLPKFCKLHRKNPCRDERAMHFYILKGTCQQ
jgi:hypothetical protein